jgi:hypothetical protein
MTPIKIAFLVVAASALVLNMQGADASPVGAAALAVQPRLVLPTHGCHKYCAWGPVMGRHRHVSDCTPTPYRCKDGDWRFW